MHVLAVEHIASDPQRHNGKPFIVGKNIMVQHIATLYNNGQTIAEIVEGYELTPGQVHAALAYYFDHKAEIDADIQHAADFLNQLQREEKAISAEDWKSKISARKQS